MHEGGEGSKPGTPFANIQFRIIFILHKNLNNIHMKRIHKKLLTKSDHGLSIPGILAIISRCPENQLKTIFEIHDMLCNLPYAVIWKSNPPRAIKTKMVMSRLI